VTPRPNAAAGSLSGGEQKQVEVARSGLAVSDHGAVLEGGRIALSGTGADLLVDPEVSRLYLGATAK